jgi:hypothetical protein
MSKRLQVVFEEAELREIQRLARRNRMTVAEWVRTSLRMARATESGGDARAKTEALRRSSLYSFPAGDIDQMLSEIESGYLETARR